MTDKKYTPEELEKMADSMLKESASGKPGKGTLDEKAIASLPAAALLTTHEKLKELFAKGKKKGKLDAGELSEVLDEMDLESDQMDSIYDSLEQLGIEVGTEDFLTDLPDDDEPAMEEIAEIEEEELVDPNTLVDSFNIDDPVRMYLREMGAVPLLDRDGEVVIAKKIETGEEDVLYALVEVPVAVEELINVGEDLKQNRIKLKDVVKTIEEDDPTEDEMNQRQRVILLLDEIKAIYKKKHKIYQKLDACCTLERRVDGVLVGKAGLTDGELGYHIYEPFRRQGYALEACRAIVKYGFETLELDKIRLCTKRSNTASRILAEKMEFVQVPSSCKDSIVFCMQKGYNSLYTK